MVEEDTIILTYDRMSPRGDFTINFGLGSTGSTMIREKVMFRSEIVVPIHVSLVFIT